MNRGKREDSPKLITDPARKIHDLPFYEISKLLLERKGHKPVINPKFMKKGGDSTAASNNDVQ